MREVVAKEFAPSPEWDALTEFLRKVLPQCPSVDARLLCSTSPQTARALNQIRAQRKRQA